jgi:cephalosporin hydroxylase
MKSLIRSAAPEAAVQWYRQVRLSAQAGTLGSRMAEAKNPEEWATLLASFSAFRPFQKRRELVRLLELLRSMAPTRICEIGTASGGTLCALARVSRADATLVTVDLSLTPERKAAFPQFARDSQRIVCLEGNSHDPAIRDQVSALLSGAYLDVLFIDGDHSYEGVRDDFAMYGPLVRDGGLVVFHDIVPDDGQRYGRPTHASTGGVPRFWSELKARSNATQEIIDDPNQDGYGLGVLLW